jgi:hypothetical protein
LIVTLVSPLKLKRPKDMVAAALTLGVAVAADVGEGVGGGVAVGLVSPVEVVPHAANANVAQRKRAPTNLRTKFRLSYAQGVLRSKGNHCFRSADDALA